MAYTLTIPNQIKNKQYCHSQLDWESKLDAEMNSAWRLRFKQL